MQRITTTLALLAAGLAAIAATAVGYRGDGSSVFPDSKPPTSFDQKTGRNVLWTADLPNWGHSSPVAAGDRVFVTCEPGWKSDWPVLVCFDAKDGKPLWSKELNHLPATALSAEQQTKVAEAWHTFLQLWGDGYARARDYRAAKTPEEKQAICDDLNGKGYRGRKANDYGGEFKAPITKEIGDLLKKGGLSGETWREGGALGTACVGQAYATPVSDGEHVWAVTAWGGFFCYDMDGNLAWAKRHPGKGGEYCRNGRSPLLYQGLLISDITALARAIDAKTGELKWSAPVDEETIMTPAVITVGGKDILLCFNRKAFLLPDGKPLAVEGGTDFGGTALVKYDARDTVFFTGGGEHGGWANKGACPTPPPSCVQFSLDGDKLVGKVLWSGIDGKPSASHTGITYYDDKLLSARGVILDAASGKVLKGDTKLKFAGATPPSGHLMSIANGQVYALAERGIKGSDVKLGVLTVFTLDGKKVAESTLANATPEGDRLTQIRRVVGRDTWGFNYGCPYLIAGDRIYIRSNETLFCIGETK